MDAHGFQHATVTKGIVFLVGIVSLLIGTQGGDRSYSLSYQAIFHKLQFWRFISSNCVFSTSLELISGLYVIYSLRVIERQLGSNKYSIYVLFSSALTTCLEVVTLAALRDPSSGVSLCSGPYGLIFASFVPIFLDLPVSKRFQVLGLTFSDKTVIYLGGLPLLLSSRTRSLIPCLCGVLAGLTYRSNVLGVRRIKVPEGVGSGAAKLFRTLLPRVDSSTTAPNYPLQDVSRRAFGTRERVNQTLMGPPHEDFDGDQFDSPPYSPEYPPYSPPYSQEFPPYSPPYSPLASPSRDD